MLDSASRPTMNGGHVLAAIFVSNNAKLNGSVLPIGILICSSEPLPSNERYYATLASTVTPTSVVRPCAADNTHGREGRLFLNFYPAVVRSSNDIKRPCRVPAKLEKTSLWWKCSQMFSMKTMMLFRVQSVHYEQSATNNYSTVLIR